MSRVGSLRTAVTVRWCEVLEGIFVCVACVMWCCVLLGRLLLGVVEREWSSCELVSKGAKGWL